jgi:hypothetical protein
MVIPTMLGSTTGRAKTRAERLEWLRQDAKRILADEAAHTAAEVAWARMMVESDSR